MRNLTEDQQISLAEQATNLVKIYTLKLKNNEVIGLTENSTELSFEGTNYKPNGETKKLEASIEGKNNAEVFGILDSSIINEQMVKSGKFLDADIEIALLDLNNLGEGKIIIKTGYIAKITYDNSSYIFDIRPFSEKLKKPITKNYSKKCRAFFGDSKCGKNLNDYKAISLVSEITSDKKFKAESLNAENYYYNYGYLQFTSGNNNGIKYDIRNYKNNEIELFQTPEFVIQTDDNFEIFVGCDKSFNCCKSKFSNAANFRGEPHIPGNDKLFRGF